jgi:type I restriction enzyme S subunit
MSDLVPEGWNSGALPEFVEINPKLNQVAELTDNLDVSFIKMEDVSNNAVVTKKQIRKYSDVSKGFTKFNDKDVLVAKITPCFENGKGAYVDELANGVGFGSTEFHVMRAKNNFDSRYLYHYTNYPSFRLKAEASMCGTGGQRRVQTDFLRTHQFISPPLPEQQKIAAILTSVDEVIEKTQAQLDKLKDLKTAMMQELLTCGVGVDGKPHTEFKDSPVGRIPKGWEVITLGDITAESAFGPRFSSDEYAVDGNIGCIRTTDIDKNWDINYSTAPRAKLNYKEFEKHILVNGDLLVTRSGTCGLVDVFKKQKMPMVAAAFLIRFRLNSSVNPYYVRYLMMSTDTQEKIQLLASGGVQKNLSGTNLKTLKMPKPSIEEQNKIVSAIESINRRIYLANSKKSSNTKIKKALMQDLLTGKVRVTVPTPSSSKASSPKAS